RRFALEVAESQLSHVPSGPRDPHAPPRAVVRQIARPGEDLSAAACEAANGGGPAAELACCRQGNGPCAVDVPWVSFRPGGDPDGGRRHRGRLLPGGSGEPVDRCPPQIAGRPTGLVRI